MAELTASDLSTFTGGRLASGDASTATVLAAALVAARRYCGWSVSPVASVTVTVDGPGGRVLALPTRNLTTLTSVSEDGVALDVSQLSVSRVKGTVTKRFGCWTSNAGGITVAMSHGYTEADAADWRRAVLRLADAMSTEGAAVQRDTPDLVRKKIDDVEYQWGTTLLSDNDRLAAMFSQFRILQSP